MRRFLLITFVASAMLLPATGKASDRTANALLASASNDPPYQQLKSFGAPSPGSTPQGPLVHGTDGALYGTTVYGGSLGYGTVFRLNPDGTGFTLLQEFDHFTTGGSPSAGLIQGTDGALYGTTLDGGSGDSGTVFRLNPDGTGFTVLKSFDSVTTGQFPSAGLIQGTDGALYGAAGSGGSGGAGTVFRLNRDGTGYTVLKSFDNGAAGGNPNARLMQGTDGALYGAAEGGGSNGHGTVFKLNPNGTGFAVLKNFDYVTSGAFPSAGLIQGTDGALYGTAYEGGSLDYGTVFRLNPDGTAFTVLKYFDYVATGGYLPAGLKQGIDGALYGTAERGGAGESGTAFRLNPDGTGFAVLKSFDYVTTGHFPSAELIQTSDGALYGTASEGGSGAAGTVFRLNPDGTGFTVLKNFPPSPNLLAGGGSPYAGLIQDADGTLYGTANAGGSGGHEGYGTVFKLNPDGTGFSVLLNLDDVTTGRYPDGALIQGTDGALYGTAIQGGSQGYGTVFRLNPDGTGFTVLVNLDGVTGSFPLSLLQGSDGALYCTANSGGTNGYGTVFKLNPDGSVVSVLLNFDDATTGAYPSGKLIQGTDGALYGTAAYGGSLGYGTVFRLNPDGTGFTVLKSFDNGAAGGNPNAGLMRGTDGLIYGAASGGGNLGYGTVFKLNPDGTGFAVLKDFDDVTSGGFPLAGLIQGPDGALYGAASMGGSNASGTVFRLTPDGTSFTVLLNLDNVPTGSDPEGDLLWGADGNLYGTTLLGGDFGGGTLFRLVFGPCTGKPDGTLCDDGNACTFGDHCVGGIAGFSVCNGTAVSCDDGDACTVDSCEAVTGACLHAPLPDMEVPGVQFTSATTLTWQALTEAIFYNTYRGTILPSESVSRPTAAPNYDQTCFEAGDTLGDGPTITTDPETPPVDTAFYYQVSEVTICREGPIGTDSDGALIPNTSPCAAP